MLLALVVLPLASAYTTVVYNDPSLRISSTIHSGAGSQNYYNNTYQNTTNVYNNYTYPANFTNVAFTNQSENWGIYNVTAAWFNGFLNWSNVKNAPSYLLTWLIPDTSNGYFYNDSTKFYFNDTKLNNTIYNQTANKVPYTGATQNVDLGTKNISVGNKVSLGGGGYMIDNGTTLILGHT